MEKLELYLNDWISKSTPDKPLWNIEKIIKNEPPKWNYIDGCMLKAIFDMFYATNNNLYFDFAKKFIDFYVNDNGDILGYNKEDYNCDSVNEGKVLFDLYTITKDEKYKKAISNIYSQVISQPRTKEGSFWHKKIYPNQIWLDGLYMVQPFYMQYEMDFNDEKNYKDIINQFENVVKLMKDKTTGLFYHGYDSERLSFWCDKQTGLSKNFWTRSQGWYAMALVDTLEKMDKMLFYEYDLLQKHLHELIDALIVFLDDKQKMFYQVTNMGNKEGNYLETSGTCAIAYSILKGVRLGYLPMHYKQIGIEIFESVYKNKLDLSDDKFVLNDICLVAGLGGEEGKGSYKKRDGTFEYYISEPKVSNDAKGLAPFLFTYAEILRLK